MVLLNGTLNRVMIVELDVSAWLVSLMVALPLVFAPFRALVGFRSDYAPLGAGLEARALHLDGHAAAVRRPGDHAVRADRAVGRHARPRRSIGQAGAALAFLLVGAGLHTTQTAGLALATDLAPAGRPAARGRAAVRDAAARHGASARWCSACCCADFSQVRLIQVIQGAALVTMVLNLVALWKQEARNPQRTRARPAAARVPRRLARFVGGGRTSRLLVARGPGHGGLQHAGHPARALWRRRSCTWRSARPPRSPR